MCVCKTVKSYSSHQWKNWNYDDGCILILPYIYTCLCVYIYLYMEEWGGRGVYV